MVKSACLGIRFVPIEAILLVASDLVDFILAIKSRLVLVAQQIGRLCGLLLRNPAVLLGLFEASHSLLVQWSVVHGTS